MTPTVFENFIKCCLKGGFLLIQILGLLGMYFDAVVVEVKTFLLFFRLALAILCGISISLQQHRNDNIDKKILSIIKYPV